jgi:isopenicillin-N epimerase
MNQMKTDDASWLKARESVCLSTDHIALNAGTLSPTPRPVLDVVTRFRRMQAEAPTDFVMRRQGVLLETARTRLARELDVDALDLVLTTNVTYAINLVVATLKLESGAEILTTDHEYGSMIYCWQRRAKRDKLTLRELTVPYESNDPAAIIDVFAKAITPKTRVLFFSHVTTQIGLILPAKEICALARKHGIITIIDGAHAPGMIPVDLASIDADFYGANCHKWMMAPAGSGFLHVRHDQRQMIQPLITSWGYPYDRGQPDKATHSGATNWQWDLEFHGGTDRCPQMAIPATLDYLDGVGRAAIAARVRYLSEHARKRFGEAGLIAATPADPRLCGSLTAFDFPVKDCFAAQQWLFDNHKIEAPFTSGAKKTFLRISTGFFNTTGEIDQLADVIPQIREEFWGK